MSQKISKEIVLKHAAFSSDYMLDINSAVAGLSVDCNVPLTENELDLNFFRSDFFIVSLALQGEALLSVNLNEYKIKKNTLFLLLRMISGVSSLINLPYILP